MLRELRSSAIRATSSTGFLEISSRLRTAFFDAIDKFGRTTRSEIRWYSIAGMMAMSAAPRAQSFGAL